MEYYNEEIKEDEVQHLPNYMNLSIHITYLWTCKTTGTLQKLTHRYYTMHLPDLNSINESETRTENGNLQLMINYINFTQRRCFTQKIWINLWTRIIKRHFNLSCYLSEKWWKQQVTNTGWWEETERSLVPKLFNITHRLPGRFHGSISN